MKKFRKKLISVIHRNINIFFYTILLPVHFDHFQQKKSTKQLRKLTVTMRHDLSTRTKMSSVAA